MSKQITISTPEGEIVYELAPFGSRLVGRIIDGLIIIIPNSIIPLIPSWLYWSLLQSSNNQATVGQKAMGLKTVALNGDKIDFGRATGRFFGNFLNILTFFIGYFMFFFNDKNQCLHDYVSGCVVVKEREIERSNDVTRHLV